MLDIIPASSQIAKITVLNVDGNTELSAGFKFFGIICTSEMRDIKPLNLSYEDNL
jgi:hypothetical protein